MSTGSMPSSRAARSISRSSPKVIAGPRHAAIRRHRAGVGGDAARPGAVFGDLVGPRILGERHQRLDPARRRVAGERADIGQDVDVEREQRAVRREGAADACGAGRGYAPRRSGSPAGPRSRRSCRGAGAPARPAARIPGTATSSARSRRRHPARRRADRPPACRCSRQSRSAAYAASAPTRSSVTRPLARSHAAWPPRPSIGDAFCRPETKSKPTTCAPANAASQPGVRTASFDHAHCSAPACARPARLARARPRGRRPGPPARCRRTRRRPGPRRLPACRRPRPRAAGRHRRRGPAAGSAARSARS